MIRVIKILKYNKVTCYDTYICQLIKEVEKKVPKNLNNAEVQ